MLFMATVTINDTMPKFQSAYRVDNFTVPRRLLPRFSTTSCWRRTRDKYLLCVLLDLTSAFDTVDHTLLLTRLQQGFGVQGSLAWFASYLSGRSYCVVIDGVASHVIHIMCSVPQGAVLGPLLLWPAIYYMAGHIVTMRKRGSAA